MKKISIVKKKKETRKENTEKRLATLIDQSGESSDSSAALVKNFARPICVCLSRIISDRNIGKRCTLPGSFKANLGLLWLSG